MSVLDITFNKHGGNAQSNAAFERGKEAHEAMRSRILALLQTCDMSGKQIAARFDVPFHTISGRFSQLKAAGLIEGSGQTDGYGSEILRLKGDGQWRLK